ncbi:hypothetical protein [Draconibacterium halophilum]|uniref:Uncharacterized protein n=1 Tax=Draconibacterium halophilum TaxID=2706887 RepID=A0A6C0REB5_9BACT|nr:hypothetical protein [Draconibacterium halophilum]QIA08276.1 hypothetical protein G0Q07_11360 [Draconibacterium halophilum]
MKRLKNIVALLLGVIFLLSTSGFILYKSYCACSGEDYTSIIVKPATCETEFHEHHKHDLSNNEVACSEGECHDCQPYAEHSDSCGCDSPESIFMKLMDKAVNDEVKFVAVQPIKIKVFSSDLLEELILNTESNINSCYYLDLPPRITSSLDYLIQIQKLKIPSIA